MRINPVNRRGLRGLRWHTAGHRFGRTQAETMRHFFALILSALASGCVNPIFDAGHTETVLPLSRAWMDGQTVEYITTDISDAAMASMMGANHVPRLRDALGLQGGKSLVVRVYKCPGAEQISVFQSAPSPIGPDNRDRAYSPLWRVVEVRWVDLYQLAAEVQRNPADYTPWLRIYLTDHLDRIVGTGLAVS